MKTGSVNVKESGENYLRILGERKERNVEIQTMLKIIIYPGITF